MWGYTQPNPRNEETMRSYFRILARHTLVAVTLALTLSVLAAPAAEAATPAEQYISQNIQHGLGILNNRSLSVAQRRDQFAHFLVNLTDMKRIALYTLGQYRRSASPADLDAFSAAFENYATAVYQSYFSRYSGQTLQILGSSPGSSDNNSIVRTVLIDPTDKSGQQPPEVDFRVYTDRGAPVVLDFSYGGIWLAETERNDFTGFLGQNGGDIHALINHLTQLAQQFRSGQFSQQKQG
jgi:phospholipid transport system substrate-binding protein